MKKLLLLLVSLSFIGCSSINVGDTFSSLELDGAMSSEDETQRILALGLTHEENLKEASKLKTPHLITVVSLQLTNARDEKIQNEIDLIESQKFADKVMVSGSRYIGSEISESIKTGVLETESDLLNYFLEGVKDFKSGNIQHKLHMTVSHNSKSNREYFSAYICNQWGRCNAINEDGSNNKLELTYISTNASNCNSFKCEYSETIEIALSDDFLRDSADKGVSLSLISKKKSHKIKVSKPYLMGYLAVAI